MLHQRDYILRLIEMAGRILIRLRNQILRRAGDPAEIDAELTELARGGGLDLELARRLDLDSLLLLVSPLGTVEPGRCWLLAELLYLDALQAEASGDADRARVTLQRALYLYRALDPGWMPVPALPEAARRIGEVEADLARLEGRPRDETRPESDPAATP